MYTPEQTLRIQQLRQKSLTPEGLTLEEKREAVTLMRKGRTGAQIAAVRSRTAKAAAKAPVDTAALLQQLLPLDKGDGDA